MNEETQVQEVPIEELSQAEFKEARSKGLSTVEKTIEKKAEAEEQKDKPKAKGGFQSRIDRLIRQNSALEEQLAAERARKAGEQQQQQRTVPADEEPKREQFQSDAEYYKASAKWEVRQEIRAEKEREQRELAAAEEKARNDAYNKRVAESKAKHEDWLEVVNQPIIIPNGVHEAIKEMDNGPEVAYFLGNHPELCEELMEMSASKATGMIWGISEKLEGEKSEENEEEEEEKPEAKAKEEEKPERKKYEPIRPVGGSNKSSVPLDKMSMADYKKAREAGRTH